ncbi:MAG TPA: DUF4184 family protein [Chitinophagaceae bacterium]|nr:DUF4184 family protein [Chitinophagaceae bacterium]HVG40750.1 DUF4184 family protein [Chitinophagaceae bacterium]
MPFTFAHPAIILPFNYFKKYSFSITGLIIGSITPDFESFIKMKGGKEFGHSIGGIFWFDLPLAIVLAFIFHLIIRNPLLNNLPLFLQKRFIKEKNFNWTHQFKANISFVLLSFLIGIVSHLFLDAFTNENGFFVKNIPFLQDSIRTDYTSLYFHNLLSVVLSCVGCLVLLYAVLQLPIDKRPIKSNPQLGYWLLILFITTIVIFLKYYSLENERMKQYWYLYISGYAIISISAFMIGLTLTSLLYEWRKVIKI